MPRRREIQKRQVTPDAKHGSALVAKFVNSLMKKGKKSTAESILYGAFDIIEKRAKDQPLAVFEKAIDNVKPIIEVLAGIPSVVYGFFGMIVLVPAVQAMVKSPFFKTVLHVKSGKGMSLFTAAVLLGIMILPTIITVSKTSLDAVPDSYYEGSLALGATHERSVFYAVLPAAKSGVLSAVILGIGRAIGETMAVVMVAGNQTWMPKGLFQGLRTMTSNIVIEMGYAADLHREALIATGVVLFVFILLINLCFSLVKGGKDYA